MYHNYSHCTKGWIDTIHRNLNCASYTLNWATKWLIRFICFSHAIKCTKFAAYGIFFGGFTELKMLFISIGTL